MIIDEDFTLITKKRKVTKHHKIANSKKTHPLIAMTHLKVKKLSPRKTSPIKRALSVIRYLLANKPSGEVQTHHGYANCEYY